jgi:hypothetical protein
MSLLEDNTAVFVIRIWFERRQSEKGRDEWRGVVEHMLTGERRYFTNLEEIAAVIEPYLGGNHSRFWLLRCLRWWLIYLKATLVRRG